MCRQRRPVSLDAVCLRCCCDQRLTSLLHRTHTDGIRSGCWGRGSHPCPVKWSSAMPQGWTAAVIWTVRCGGAVSQSLCDYVCREHNACASVFCARAADSFSQMQRGPLAWLVSLPLAAADALREASSNHLSPLISRQGRQCYLYLLTTIFHLAFLPIFQLLQNTPTQKSIQYAHLRSCH